MVVIHKKHKETAEEKITREHQEQASAMGLQDEYQARGFELVSWVQHHKGLVSGFIVLLLLSGVFYSGYLYYQNRRAEEASAALVLAVKEFEALEQQGLEENKDGNNKEKRAAVAARFSDIVKSYGSSDVAALASLYAGHMALADNDAAQAIVRYREASAKLDKSNPVYPLALIGLGYALDKSGDYKGALSSFEQIIQDKNAPGTDLALWESARLAQLTEEPQKAAQYVDRLLEEYPSSAYEKNAKKLKAELRQ